METQPFATTSLYEHACFYSKKCGHREWKMYAGNRKTLDPVKLVSGFTDHIRVNLLRVALALYDLNEKMDERLKFNMEIFGRVEWYSEDTGPMRNTADGVDEFLTNFNRHINEPSCGTSACACGIAALLGIFEGSSDLSKWTTPIKENLVPLEDDFYMFVFQYLFGQYWESDQLATAGRIAHFALNMSTIDKLLQVDETKKNMCYVFSQSFYYNKHTQFLRELNIDWNVVRAIVDLGTIDVTFSEIQQLVESGRSVTEAQKFVFPASEPTPSANV